MKMKCTSLLTVTAITIVLALSGVRGIASTTYTTKVSGKNVTCYMCHMGFHWVADCQENNQTATCTACPSGKFQSTFNIARDCETCRTSCPSSRMKLVHLCNSTTDNVCQCVPGFYEDEPNVCVKHAVCDPGQGVSRIGSPYNDTACEPCVAGKTFSSIPSTTEQCMLCRQCLDGGKIKHHCTRTNNTVCSNTSGSQQGSEDLSTGAIVGIVVGSIAGLVALLLIVFLILVAIFGWTETKKKISTCCGLRHKPKKAGDKGNYDTVNSGEDSSPTHQPLSDIMSPTENGESGGAVYDNLGPKFSKSNGVSESDRDPKTSSIASSQCEQQDSDNITCPTMDEEGKDEDTDRPAATATSEVSRNLLSKLSGDLIDKAGTWVHFFNFLIPEKYNVDVDVIREEVVVNNKDSVREQIYQMFRHWQNIEGKDATLDKILAALKEINRNDLVEKYRPSADTSASQ